jgi:hypothetical protein
MSENRGNLKREMRENKVSGVAARWVNPNKGRRDESRGRSLRGALAADIENTSNPYLAQERKANEHLAPFERKLKDALQEIRKANSKSNRFFHRRNGLQNYSGFGSGVSDILIEPTKRSFQNAEKVAEEKNAKYDAAIEDYKKAYREALRDPNMRVVSTVEQDDGSSYTLEQMMVDGKPIGPMVDTRASVHPNADIDMYSSIHGNVVVEATAVIRNGSVYGPGAGDNQGWDQERAIPTSGAPTIIRGTVVDSTVLAGRDPNISSVLGEDAGVYGYRERAFMTGHTLSLDDMPNVGSVVGKERVGPRVFAEALKSRPPNAVSVVKKSELRHYPLPPIFG